MNIILAYEKFKNDLVNLVNNSGVPMFMIRECMDLVLTKVAQVADQELARVKEQTVEAETEE